MIKFCSCQLYQFFPKGTKEYVIPVTYNLLKTHHYVWIHVQKIEQLVEIYIQKEAEWNMIITYLVCMATRTKIQSLPFTFGSPMVKYMNICSHIWLGIRSGSSIPTSKENSALFSWHSRNSLTWLRTSSFVPFHEDLSRIELYVLK